MQASLNISQLAVKTLEFFAGIGGLHAACPWLDVCCAFDIDRDAREVYQANFSNQYQIRELASVSAAELENYKADLWWLSPPCTPFTRKGQQRDDADPRTQGFLHLMYLATLLKPRWIAIENVVGFETSRTAFRVQELLTQSNYVVEIVQKCPSEFGWPNRRPRIYILARQSDCREPEILWPSSSVVDLRDFIDPQICRKNSPHLWIDPEQERFLHAMHRVMPFSDSHEIDLHGGEGGACLTACFGSGYGTSAIRSGSVVWQEQGWRRFSPREVANLLGFAKDFCLTEKLGDRRLWHLLGNSLSLPVVRSLLSFTNSPKGL